MAVDASAPNKHSAWQPLQATVADFRAECGDLESLLQGLFEDLDRLRCELEHKVFELDTERQQAAEHEQQLSEQREDVRRLSEHLDNQDQRLAETLASVNEMRAQLSREPEADALRKKLDEAHAELLRLAKVTGELADARLDVADARGELLLLREQLGTVSSTNVDAQRLVDIQQERDTWQAEAEAQRARATELQQAVSDQRHEMEKQRDELTGELKQLRRFVEMQTDLLVQRNSPQATNARGTDGAAGTVAAQFSKLQRDVAERRKSRT